MTHTPPDLSDERVREADELADAVLKAAGSALRHYYPSNKDAIRRAAAAGIEAILASRAADSAEPTPSRNDVLEEAARALARAVSVAEEARKEWDKAPSGARAGKLLIALGGHCPGYRRDIDEIHSTLDALRAALKDKTP